MAHLPEVGSCWRMKSGIFKGKVVEVTAVTQEWRVWYRPVGSDEHPFWTNRDEFRVVAEEDADATRTKREALPYCQGKREQPVRLDDEMAAKGEQ